MSTASVSPASLPHSSGTFVHAIGRMTLHMVAAVGDLAVFSLKMTRWMCTRLPQRHVILPCLYQIGVLSLPVVIVTGGFIGMELAGPSYDQFRLVPLGK